MATPALKQRGELLLLPTLGLVGCMAASARGDETTYTLAPWFFWSLVGSGALLAAVGLLIVVLRRGVWPRVGGAALALLAPSLLGLAAYKASLEYVTVADDRVEYGVGSVLAPGKKVVRFDDCRRLEFRVRPVAGEGLRRQEEVTPYLVLKDGGEEDIGRVMFRGPVLDDLIARLGRRGVPVVGDRRGL